MKKATKTKEMLDSNVVTVKAKLICSSGGHPEEYDDLKEDILNTFPAIRLALVGTKAVEGKPTGEYAIHIKASIDPSAKRTLAADLTNFCGRAQCLNDETVCVTEVRFDVPIRKRD